MYACTSTRPDIAYPVHKLCQCLTKPTPDLIRETDHLFAYLGRHKEVGLTYTREYAKLRGFSDASWEERNSTSGWVVLWQSAAISWGSQKQKSVALSTCEAESPHAPPALEVSNPAENAIFTPIGYPRCNDS